MLIERSTGRKYVLRGMYRIRVHGTGWRCKKEWPGDFTTRCEGCDEEAKAMAHEPLSDWKYRTRGQGPEITEDDLQAAREAMKRKAIPLSAESKKADATLIRLVKKAREAEKMSVTLAAEIGIARAARDEAFTADRLKAGIWTDAHGTQIKFEDMGPDHLARAIAYFERKLSFVQGWETRVAALRKESKRREKLAKVTARKRSAK